MGSSLEVAAGKAVIQWVKFRLRHVDELPSGLSLRVEDSRVVQTRSSPTVSVARVGHVAISQFV